MRTVYASLILACTALILAGPAWAGPLRINLVDGSSVQVPYFWEEAGEVKFEVPGGVVGISKSQVASVQEVLAAKEFDPEVLVDTPQETNTQDPSYKLQQFVASRLPLRPTYEKLDADQTQELLKAENLTHKNGRPSTERLRGPLFNVESESAELVRVRGEGAVLLMQNILSSREDLKGVNFTLAAYDGDRNVLQRKSCEVQEIPLDQQTQGKLQMSGRLFSVTTTVRPDPRIKSYEIVAARR
jgi:hypothetical protein